MRLRFFKKRNEPPASTPAAFPVKKKTSAGSAFAQKMDDSKSVGAKFPTIQSIGINLAVKAPFNDVEPTLRGKSFTPESLAIFEFHCKNVDCVGGGFDVTDAIEEMVKQGSPEITGRRICRGWASKEFINQRRCHYELNFRILVRYL